MRAARWSHFALAWLVLAGCGGGAATTLGAGSANAGTVVERAEGFAERPGWADAERPFSRNGDTVRVVGYVAIDAGQRVEAGHRAADSYARAELIKLLSVRVVAVLEDELEAGEPGKLSERIEETASSWVDELIIAQRYFEKRRDGSAEKIHIWSRLDIDQAAVAELLERATADAEDLRGKSAKLAQALSTHWDRLAEVSDVSARAPLVPAGVFTPEWAKAGDIEQPDGFRFVCYGLAEDEGTARALARARCSEKLCRLFGVQIIARTTVIENLEGVSAESEVSEQCADVRVKSRDTVYQSGECGPRGCVQWLMQSYPRSAYEEERRRLDQPSVIRQQVVIQEGDKHYRDPEQCEASLRAYGSASGFSAAAFEERKKQLTRALAVCQDIDTRDSGLFLSLSQLLTAPLPTFTSDLDDPDDRSMTARAMFTYAGARWRADLETKRFLTDRIQAVRVLVSDAILPMRILDYGAQGADRAAVDALFREVVKFPFNDQPASAHHLENLHELAVQLVAKKIAPSPIYRDFLLAQAERGLIKCTRATLYTGSGALDYFASDGAFDDREWKTALAMLRAADENGGAFCMPHLFREADHGAKRAERLDEVAGMIASGELKYRDQKELLKYFLRALPRDEAPAVMLRWHAKTPGSDSEEQDLVDDVLFGSFMSRSNKEDDLARCTSMPDAVRPIFEQLPGARTSKTYLCFCLREGKLPATARRAIVELLFKYGDESCNNIRPDEWPGGYYEVKQPEYRSARTARPFPPNASPLQDEIKSCLEQHVPLRSGRTQTSATATLTSARLTKVKVDTKVYGGARDFERKAGRGYLAASELHAMNKAASACIARLFEGFTIPYGRNEPKPARVWFELWDANLGNSGYEE